MHRQLLLVGVLGMIVAACGGGDGSPPADPNPPTHAVATLTNWWATSPDEDLGQYTTADIIVTFSNDSPDTLVFNSTPQMQLWFEPSGDDGIGVGAVTINAEPAGMVAPGGMFSYDLTIDLTGVSSGDLRIVMRPRENSVQGVLEPSDVTLVSGGAWMTP